MITRWALLSLLWLGWASTAMAAGTISSAGGPLGGLPAVGAEGDCLLVVNGEPGWGACPGSGSGAPTDATYITQTANPTLSAEQALSTLATGILKVTTTTGVVSVAVKGTDYPGLDFANVFTTAQAVQPDTDVISLTLRRNGAAQTANVLEVQTELNATLASIDKTGAITAPSFTGDVTGNVTGNASTATALAANGANCSAGSAPLGVDTAGAVESCTNYAEEPGSNGLVARTAANTMAARTITGTSEEISVSNGDGASGNPTLSFPNTVNLSSKILRIPNSASLPATCTVGDLYMDTDATTGQRLYACQATNTWAVQGDGGGGGSIGGTVGTTDNAIPRANGTGGSTLQASGCTISDTDVLTCAGGFSGATSGTGTLTMLEGAAAGAGTNAGEHNVYFDSADSLLKSHENGGSVVTYHSTANLPAALAANGANCSSGQFPLGVSAAGASENCTALPTTIAGTANAISASASTGAVTLDLDSTIDLSSKTVRVPNSTALPGTCTVGDAYMDTNATTGLRFYLCEATNSWVAQGSGGGSGIASLASQTGGTQTITRGVGIGGSSSADDHSFTLDLSELTANQTMFNGGQASQTITYSLSGATDPVLTLSNGAFNVSTGTLQQAGVNVVTETGSQTLTNKTLTSPVISSISNTGTVTLFTASDTVVGKATTDTLTNKTVDCEGTGNVCTQPHRLWFPAAGCNNATAGPIWDLPSSSPAVAACVTGTNTQKGVLEFADGSNLSAQTTYALPSTWTGAIDAKIKWVTTATSGDVVWQLSTVCVADAETDDPAFNTASTVTDTAKGTTLQINDASITNVTATGCAAGELLHLKIQRDSAHASDTLAATARLIGVEMVIREAM